MSSVSNFIKSFFVSLCSTVIFLLILEVFFRIPLASERIHNEYVNGPGRTHLQFIYDEDVGWRTRPNLKATLRYPHRMVKEYMNEDGWRDRSYPFEKKPSVTRIGAMGDSFTYGFGVELNETYPKVLERLFNERGGPEVEVMNLGVNGWGLDQILIGYKKFVRQYKPDLLVVFYSADVVLRTDYAEMWNTPKPYFLVSHGKLKMGNVPVPQKRFSSIDRWFIRNSRLYEFLKDRWICIVETRKYQRLSNYGKFTISPALWKLNTEILKLFKMQTEADGTRLLVFVWDKSAPLLKRICQEAGVEVVDLQDMLSGIDMRSGATDGSPLHYPPPVMHWNVVGNRYVAQALYKYIAAKHYVQ